MSNINTYAIGAAARLSGLTPHTLRKWEDRYQAVTPTRTEGGDRRYSRDDIKRLSRLKELVDGGHTIGSIANLDDTSLANMLGRTVGDEPEPHQALGIAVIGDRLAAEIEAGLRKHTGVSVVQRGDTVEDLVDTAADVVAVEFGSLTSDTRQELKRIRSVTGCTSLVVIYRFAALADAESLSDSRTAVVTRPFNFREFARTLVAISAKESPARPSLGLPPHRFSRRQLSNVAMMSPTLACECPRHVAQIIIELSEFERYSEECEDTKPHDAQIHNMLRKTAATARSLFEDAMLELAEAEEFEIVDR